MNIKYRSSVIYGALNLFLEISLIKTHVKCRSDQEILFNTLQTNSYFAHPHNVLIAMLGDECFSTRKEAIDRIVRIRNSDIECLNYHFPKVNFNAVKYWELCSMRKEDNVWVFLNSFSKYVAVTEPPILKGVDLSPYLTEPFTSDLPCHTQSVERMVKLTTEVSKAVCGRVNQCAEGMLVLKGREESKLR
jgi:hypothetical protein